MAGIRETITSLLVRALAAITAGALAQGKSHPHHPGEHRDLKHDQVDLTEARNAEIPVFHQRLVPKDREEGKFRNEVEARGVTRS